MSRVISLIATLAILAGSTAQAEVRKYSIHGDGQGVFVSNDTWQPEGFDEGTTVPASFIEENLVSIDGYEDEPAWRLAPEVTVPMTFGSVENVSVKALYSPTDVFIRVRWRDETENREHHPWVWDPETQRYVEGPQVEDSLILSFEAGCEWMPSFLGGYQYDFDGWQWLAARSDPVYQAVDLAGTMQNRDVRGLNFIPYQSRVETDTWVMKFIDKDTTKFNASWEELDRVFQLQRSFQSLYYRGEPDNTRRFPKVDISQPPPKDPPVDGKGTYPQFVPVRLEGEAGEVSAKGQWQDGYWTVEFQRVLVTPAMTKNDAVFTRLTQFSVHVFDAVERVDESSESGRLFLRFMPKAPMFVNE